MNKQRVYITVDTETSMGGAWSKASHTPLSLEQTVFGESAWGALGIPLIMDILETHGFRATFFTEVLCGYNVGFDKVEKVLRYIQGRGHDAQLHLHPEQLFYYEHRRGGPRREEGLLFTFPEDEQRRLVAQGVRLFRELSGRPPVAFRAGCYGASEVSLRALHTNGIVIDSSHNLAYLGASCGFQQRLENAPRVIEGVHEYPVTNFLSGPSGAHKPLEISAVSVTEILRTIRSLRDTGCSDVVLVLHSFSLMKNRGIRFENIRPDRIVIARMRGLCAALVRLRDEIEVRTLAAAPLQVSPQPGVVPEMGWFRPAMRKAVQAMNYVPWL